MRALLYLPLLLSWLAGTGILRAQSVQPVIAEYIDRASGSFQVTNTTLVPMAVVLEPKSFTIAPDGQGSYRSLDRDIHLELSVTSLRLEPRQSATVFYKVSAERAPAWLCIYAAFSALHPGPGINLRIMLPHTVYVYQRHPLSRDDIEVASVRYDREAQTILCQLSNRSALAGRADSILATGDRVDSEDAGFPLLPHATRELSIPWTARRPPETVVIEFPHFKLKLPVSAE